MCPIVLNYIQNIFPGGDEKFSRGPLGYVPVYSQYRLF